MKFDPSYSHVAQTLYNNYFRDKIGGFFIECGACDGEKWHECRPFVDFMNWKGINIEASPKHFEKLKGNMPTCLNLNIALSDKNGTATFNEIICNIHSPAIGNASLNHTPAHLAHLQKIFARRGGSISKIQVQTLTYKTMIERYNIQNIDVFVLDVEGCELTVIGGMTGAKYFPAVMCVEFDWIELAALQSALTQLNYKFDFTEINNAYFSYQGSKNE